jgi:DNA-binding NtrC family response regulator
MERRRTVKAQNFSPDPRMTEVLLVEEDRNDLRHYRDMLQTMRCQVKSSPSYHEGVRLVESGEFGLVVLGQGSSKFEGRRVLERAMEIDRHLPVVVIARPLDFACYLDAMWLGAVDYLEGPITAQQMERTLNTYLRPRRARRQAAVRQAAVAEPQSEF